MFVTSGCRFVPFAAFVIQFPLLSPSHGRHHLPRLINPVLGS